VSADDPPGCSRGADDLAALIERGDNPAEQLGTGLAKDANASGQERRRRCKPEIRRKPDLIAQHPADLTAFG